MKVVSSVNTVLATWSSITTYLVNHFNQSKGLVDRTETSAGRRITTATSTCSPILPVVMRLPSASISSSCRLRRISGVPVGPRGHAADSDSGGGVIDGERPRGSDDAVLGSVEYAADPRCIVPPRRGGMLNMAFNIADLFEHVVDTVPERTAIITPAARVTYGELEERANRLASHLAAHGVTRGSHVGIYSHNRVEFVEGMLAAFKLRAVPININYRYLEEELEYVFDDADLVALIHERRFSPLVAAVLPRTPKIAHVVVLEDGSDTADPTPDAVEYEAALASGSPERSFEPRSDDDLYVLYTGGTTGKPKGVMWRHEDVFRTLGGGINVQTGEAVPTDTTLAEHAAEATPMISHPTAPLMHGSAQWGTLGGLFQGNTIVLLPKFDAHGVWETIERERVNVMLITGDAMARPLVEALRERSYDTSSLVAISSTAAVFSPSVRDEFMELLPNVYFSEAIGSSETGFSGMAARSKGDGQQGGGPNVTLGRDTIVIGDDGKPVRPGSGEIGRVARSGNVPIGYYKDPAKTAQTFVTIDGVRYSIPGDFALVEADGTMTLLGRGSGCINSGGEKIYPEEVEAVLKSHPDVFDCLVVGVPDERWGQAVAAVVQPRAGRTPTLEDLAAHVRETLAAYKTPRSLFLVDEIQRHPSGKPNYPWAQEHARSAQAQT